MIRGNLLLVLLAALVGVRSQDLDVEVLGLDDGLPHREVFGSCYDERGLLWISTKGGLSVYDGYRARRIDTGDRPFTGALVLDERRRIVCIRTGSVDSVDYFDPLNRTYGSFSMGDGRSTSYNYYHRNYEPLYFIRGNHLWASNRGRPLRRVTIHPDDRLVYVDERRHTVVSPHRGVLSRWSDGHDEALPLPGDGPIDFAYLGGDGTHWLAQNGTLYRLPSGGRSFQRLASLAGDRRFTYVTEDWSHRIIAAHIFSNRLLDGVMVDTNGTVESLDHILDIENRVESIHGRHFLEDFRINSYGGLYLAQQPEDRSLFQRYVYDPSVEAGKFGLVARGMAVDTVGNVYVVKSAEDPHWYRIGPRGRALDTLSYLKADGSPAESLDCLMHLAAFRGRIYAGYCPLSNIRTGGLLEYTPATGTYRWWGQPDTTVVTRALHPLADSSGLLLFTEDRTDFVEGGILEFYPARDSFATVEYGGERLGGYVKAAVADTARRCSWIGTTDGLYRFDWVSHWLHRYSPGPEITVSSVIVDGAGLLVGTFGMGLLTFNPEAETFSWRGGLTMPETYDSPYYLPLPSDEVAGILRTPEGYLLLTTFNGLVLHGPDDNTLVYTTDHGLTNNEFNSASLLYNPADERYYAGGVNGWVGFRIKDLLPQPSPYRPLITGIGKLDRDREEEHYRVFNTLDTQLVIDPATLYFYLNYTLPGVQDATRVLYQTKLEGYDPVWTPSSPEPSQRYTRLRPGSYTFRLRAIDDRGNITSSDLILPIRVLAPWYSNSWFRLSALLALIGLFILVFCIRYRVLAERMEQQRKLLRTELLALRQQINPHFISNAMNAIREYVLVRDREEAAGYLADFNSLMRTFLESSRRRFVPIDEEVDMLRRYARLEQLRFPERFTFTVELGEGVDPEMDEVPSLLLQPLLENAINHAFSDGIAGQILLRITACPHAEEAFLVQLFDNGMGRRRSESLKKSSLGGHHRSRATEILRDRQALLEDDDSVRLMIHTDDLYPAEERSGTVVSLYISYSQDIPPPGAPPVVAPAIFVV